MGGVEPNTLKVSVETICILVCVLTGHFATTQASMFMSTFGGVTQAQNPASVTLRL